MAHGRVGYALGYGKFTNVREMSEVMQQAEERGFEMAFFSETIELMRDSVSSLAAIGLATKKLKLGTTQIVRLRGPVVMAQSLATLDELTGGRMTIAPGACTKSHARVHALPQDVGATPTEVLKDYVESIRLLLKGEKCSYHGKFVNFDDVGLGWKPIRSNIPIYLPATATVGLGRRDWRRSGPQRGVLTGIHGQCFKDRQRFGGKSRAGFLSVPSRADHQLFGGRRS
jgi:5,10-methylenetetrahydromethanopterin reductase